MNLKTGWAALAAAAAAAAVAMPADAQDAKPTPTTCAGAAFADPPDDQYFSTHFNQQQGPKAPANHDIVGGFFRYAPDAAGKNVLTANIVVANLDDELAAGANAVSWYMHYTVGETVFHVDATMADGGAFTYEYGQQGTGSLETEGETTGTSYPGKDGLISIVVPVSAQGLEGKSLATPFATSRVTWTLPNGSSIIPVADRGPNSGGGKGFKVTPCAEPGTATPAQPAGGGGPVAPPSGGGDGTTAPPGGGSPAGPAPTGPATLDLKVVAGKLSARKVKRKRGFAVKLVAGERITGLKAKLLKGKKGVGSGKVAAVGPGNGKMKLKIAKKAARKLKKGTYKLTFTGTKADGRKASGSVLVRLRK